MTMGKYVRKADPVDAVKLDTSTGDIVIGPATVTAGSWLLKHEDGTFTTGDDAWFAAEYEAAPAEDAPPVDPPPDPAAVPGTV